MSESEEGTISDDFVVFPINNLVAVFHDVDSMNLVIDELEENGFERDGIRAFVGQEGKHALDFDGSGHGPMAELLRSFQRIGPDRTYIERYEKYMNDGDSILMVRTPKNEMKQRAADIMREHSPHRLTFFGALVIEEV